MLPAARVVDTGAPPDAGGAVEVEEPPRTLTRDLLDPEVRIEHHGLRACQPRRVAIEMPPARLHEPDARVGEVRQQAPQEVGRGHEVGIEHRHERLVGGGEAVRERTGLEAVPAAAPHLLDADARRARARDRGRTHFSGDVAGVIEQLHAKRVARPIERRDGVEESPDHRLLIANGQLHEDLWLVAGRPPRLGCERCLRRRAEQPPAMRGIRQQPELADRVGGGDEHVGGLGEGGHERHTLANLRDGRLRWERAAGERPGSGGPERAPADDDPGSERRRRALRSPPSTCDQPSSPGGSASHGDARPRALAHDSSA